MHSMRNSTFLKSMHFLNPASKRRSAKTGEEQWLRICRRNMNDRRQVLRPINNETYRKRSALLRIYRGCNEGKNLGNGVPAINFETPVIFGDFLHRHLGRSTCPPHDNLRLFAGAQENVWQF